MKNLRNLHDPIPAKMNYATCHKLGREVAERLGFARGGEVEPIFKKLDGSYDNVWDTFGRNDDIYVYRPDKSWTVTHEHGITMPWYVGHRNEILVEGIGHLIMHFSMVRKTHGENAAMAVARFKHEPDEERARNEAIRFMIGFLIPDEAARDMFTRGFDDATVAEAFGVTRKLAAARRKAVANWTLQIESAQAA